LVTVIDRLVFGGIAETQHRGAIDLDVTVINHFQSFFQ
jgi:hypothetical protein